MAPARSSTPHFLLRAALVLCVLLLGTAAAKADAVAVGVLSFDILNTSPGLPGQNAFTITNDTGLNSIFPDLPVASNVIFLGATLTPFGPGNPGATPLGDIGPSPGFSQVPVLDTDTFSSALFQATLSQTLFSLGNGTSFQADSNVLTATLLPSSGNTLTAGVDLIVLTASGATVVAPTPEPPSWFLLLVALPLILLRTIGGGKR